MHRPAVADYPPGAQLAERVLDDYEFVWMMRGHATVTAAEPFDLRPGQLLLVPAGFRHGFVWDRRRPTRHGYVHFAADDVRRSLPSKPRLAMMTRQDPLRGLCAYLLWLGSSDDDCLGPARQALDLLVALVDDGPLPETEAPAALPPALRAVLAHLRTIWSRSPLPRVGVSQLAAMSGVSRGYLNRMFQAAFALSAANALERVRCARAEAMLVRTDLSAQAIAFQCGYADLSHFSHRFTAIHGLPPTAYRHHGGTVPSVLDHAGVRRLDRLLRAGTTA
jgi:AraC family transcriptional regulator